MKLHMMLKVYPGLWVATVHPGTVRAAPEGDVPRHTLLTLRPVVRAWQPMSLGS